MVGYVYILQTKGNHYYVGSTNNLDRRLLEHQLGKTKSLKNLLPFNIIFSQKFNELVIARKIEAKLKKFKSRKIIKRIISDKKNYYGPVAQQ